MWVTSDSGIGLIHELRQLAGTKELPNYSRYRFGIDQLLRGQVLGFRHAQALADRAFDADQPDPELVLHQFTDRAYPAVAEVVDVVNFPLPVLEVDQGAHDIDDVVLAERTRALRRHRARAGG